jgi:lysophospholipase L1-like esterase
VSKEGIFLSGHSFRPSSASYAYYSGVNRLHLRNFEECYLLYGITDSTSTFRVNDSTFQFESHNPFNKQLVQQNQETVHATFSGNDNQVYGFSFESQSGIFVDNLAFRGISGIEIQKINSDVLSAINNSHPYDLIILQYGPNLLFKPDLTDFRWYEKPMKNAVMTLKKHFPYASILVIGSADKGARYEGEVMTQKGVLPLIDVQHKVAYETGTNFWNLYLAMGGRNTMARWASMKPPLANVDYTHLTHKGSAVIARILYDKLMQIYDPEAASRAQIQPVVRYVAVSRGL